mgnify:CR=1 FL=1
MPREEKIGSVRPLSALVASSTSVLHATLLIGVLGVAVGMPATSALARMAGALKQDAPKDEPKQGAPKQDAPKQDAPKQDAPKQGSSEPAMDEPKNDKPAPDAPNPSNPSQPEKAAPKQGADPGSAEPSVDVEQIRSAAQSAMKKGEWSQASNGWTTLLQLLPGDEEAVRERARAQAMLEGGTVIQSVSSDREIRRQQATAQFTADVKRAQGLLAQQDYDQAKLAAVTARTRLDLARNVLNAQEFEQMSSQAEKLVEIGRAHV